MLKILKLLLITVTILYNLNTQAKPIDQNSSKEQWITIFVHGIIGIKPHLTFANFFRIAQDKISSTVYARTIELTRQDPFFFQGHTMQTIGMHKIEIHDLKPGNASAVFAHYYDQFQQEFYPEQETTYYTYGWSGLLSRKMRYHESELFYHSIVNLIKKFKMNGINPKVRIVGYSHGGDFSLKLATVSHHHLDEPLYIDELILIGTPVLPEAHGLVHDAMFKKIFHIYSYGDRVQKVDFFSSQHLFSHRTFKKSCCLSLPSNLTQINLQVMRPIFSRKRECHEFFDCKRHIRNIDPGHTELWSFGWTPQSYRAHFPLYPFPVATFIPFIRHVIESECTPKTYSYIVEFRPYSDSLLVYSKYPRRNRTATRFPFICNDEFKILQEEALQYKPEGFTTYEYDKHINEHLEQAEREYKLARCNSNKRTQKCSVATCSE